MKWLLLGAAIGVAAAGRTITHERTAGCSNPGYRQFDFFVGDWDTYEVGDTSRVIARNRVSPMLGGCAIREVYEQQDGLAGESFSTYDAAHRAWHQSWVTNRGQLLLLDGGLEGGRMVLRGVEWRTAADSGILRGIWSRAGTDVRETADRSVDGGKTWTPVFDILFRPHGRRGT
jgi:hypothetical protein